MTIINEEINNIKVSFQDGCDKIVGKLTALEYPPEEPKGPDEICDAIDKMYADRYAQGLAANTNTSGNAHIVYTYHTHVSSCIGNITCTATANIISVGGSYPCNNPDHGAGHQHHNGTARCPRCGKTFTVYDMTSWEDANMKTTRVHSGPGYVCGKTTSTIEKAEIAFD